MERQIDLIYLLLVLPSPRVIMMPSCNWRWRTQEDCNKNTGQAIQKMIRSNLNTCWVMLETSERLCWLPRLTKICTLRGIFVISCSNSSPLTSCCFHSLGCLVSIENLSDPHSQRFLRGHDMPVRIILVCLVRMTSDFAGNRCAVWQYPRAGVSSLLDSWAPKTSRAMRHPSSFGRQTRARDCLC